MSAGEPFFLHVAYNAGLPPYRPPGLEGQTETFDTWIDGTRADYVAMVEHLDVSVGRILEALERHASGRDTVVLLTYDHGGAELATEGPFSGGFATLREGGIRVPMILRWPARVTAGTVSSELGILMDVAPTLPAATGMAPDQPMDGHDLLRPAAAADSRTLHWRIDLPGYEGQRARVQRAARQGRWKYLCDDGSELLFDLASDPGERNDLGRRSPDRLSALRSLSSGRW